MADLLKYHECQCKIEHGFQSAPRCEGALEYTGPYIKFCPLHEAAKDLLYHLILNHKEHRVSTTCKTCALIERAGSKGDSQ